LPVKNESLTEAQHQPLVGREQDSSEPCYPQGVPALRAVNTSSLRCRKRVNKHVGEGDLVDPPGFPRGF